jgi:hypothetical protein
LEEEEFALQSLQKSKIKYQQSSIHVHSVEILGGIVRKSAVDRHPRRRKNLSGKTLPNQGFAAQPAQEVSSGYDFPRRYE